MKILLAENSPDDAAVLTAALQALFPDDLDIATSTLFVTTKQLLQRQAFDLIVLDLAFQDSIDYDTYPAIRPYLGEAQVIIYSAHLDRRMRGDLIRAGARYFLPKRPLITPDEALEYVQRELMTHLVLMQQVALEPSYAEVMERLTRIERQIEQVRHTIWEGNGTASIMQRLGVMDERLKHFQGDIDEIKPQVNAMAQTRASRMVKIVTLIAGVLTSGLIPYVLYKLGVKGDGH